jgi:thioredoxin-like negative regulator of GroEL
MEYFGIASVPAALLYKDGQQVKKVEGKDPAGMEEIAKLLA